MGEQPVFTTQAHVFQIDPDTKRSWLPVSKQAIPVSYYADSPRSSYRIVAIDGSKVIINSLLTTAMVFTKTSQKFGQWSENKSSTVYGLGFSSEHELSKFEEQFNEIKAVLETPISAYANLPSPLVESVTRSASLQPTRSSGVNGHHFVNSGSGSVRSGSSTSSYEDDTASASGSHRSASNSSESQLKYENDRLKQALAQSSANAKKWESELQTLRNNNARLTAALQESTVNVEKWKEQLNYYKEENTKLRKLATDHESSSTQNTSQAQNMERQKIESERRSADLEGRLKRREEEVVKLSQQLKDGLTMKEESAALESKIQQLQNENRHLKVQLSHSEEKSRDSDRSTSVINQCGDLTLHMQSKLQELIDLNEKMKSLVVT